MDIFTATTLSELLKDAADHHDASKPEVTHDLTKLANHAAGIDRTGSIWPVVFDNPVLIQALQAALAAALARLIEKMAPKTTPQPPVVVPPTPPVTPPSQGSGTAAGKVEPASIKFSLNNIVGPRRNDCPPVGYVTHVARRGDSGEDEVIVRTDGPTALDDKSLVRVDAEVYDANSVGIRIEDHPELAGCVEFVAEDAATGEILGTIGGAPGVAPEDVPRYENGVGWSGDRYEGSKRMSCEANLKRQGGPIRLYGRLAAQFGGARSWRAVVTPEVR